MIRQRPLERLFLAVCLPMLSLLTFGVDLWHSGLRAALVNMGENLLDGYLYVLTGDEWFIRYWSRGGG